MASAVGAKVVEGLSADVAQKPAIWMPFHNPELSDGIPRPASSSWPNVVWPVPTAAPPLGPAGPTSVAGMAWHGRAAMVMRAPAPQ